MSGLTNFIQVNPNSSNQEIDSSYVVDALVTGGITTDAILPSIYLNKKDYQFSTMIAALAVMLANKGFSTSDGSPSADPVTPTPNTAVTALAAVLANILTTADYATIIANVFAGVSFSIVSATPGNYSFIKFPAALGGLLIQWGASTGSVVFPRQFTVVPGVTVTAENGSINIVTGSVSTNGMAFNYAGSPAHWIAIGK